MRLTVAICTWNRCELLRQTLAQMTRLTLPADVEWQLLIIDNNCTDATRSVIDTFAGLLPTRVLQESIPGKSHACNRALREASGDLIVWTDDDVLVGEGWLAAVAAAARAYPEAAGFGGPIEPWFLEPPDPDLLAAFPALANGFCGLDYQRAAGPLDGNELVWGANMAYRRAAISGLMFNSALGPSPTSAICGEEVDFQRRLRARGGAIVWCPDMTVKHCVAPARATLPYLKEFAFGKGKETIQLLGRPDDGPQLFGAPRWLWRERLSVEFAYTVSRLRLPVAQPRTLRSGPPPVGLTKRAMQLVWLRERMFLAGMLAACRERGTVTGDGGSTVSAGFHETT